MEPTSSTSNNGMEIKLDLTEIVNRPLPPAPWAEGEKIPWDEPGFSGRMLKMHLSQDHDWASRRMKLVEQHVDWLERNLLSREARILDLGCGPGLYTTCLAQRGHECVGIDFSPASIEYAQSEAAKHRLSATYQHADVRRSEFGNDFDLVMMLFGEINVFRTADAESLCNKAHGALNEGGTLLIEPHTFEEVQRQGQAPAWWQSEKAGLFLESPHLWLQENFWHEDISAATTRYMIVDADSGLVRRYSSTMQAYTNEQMEDMLLRAGFGNVQRHPNLGDSEDQFQDKLQAFTATKGNQKTCSDTASISR
jgi:SAM-dependent methyltransferase